jgi:acetyl esterase/lipase
VRIIIRATCKEDVIDALAEDAAIGHQNVGRSVCARRGQPSAAFLLTLEEHVKIIVRTFMLVAVCTIATRALAQEPVQGQAAARNAFPVPSTVRVTRDLVYAEYGSRRLKLDLYLPPQSSPAKLYPGVVVVRGGGWRQGDKEAFGFIAGQLAKEGIAAASIEYRVSDEAKFPAAAYDVKAAVRWMRANGRAHGINPKTIGAIGGSAGGHLVALLATSGGIKELEGTGGNAATSSAVQAVVSMACVCNLDVDDGGGAISGFIGTPLSAHADAVKLGSPVAHVSRQSAPLLLLHSRTDPVVPYAMSVEIEQRYRRAGATATLKTIDAPDTHAFWNQTTYFPETIRLAVDFLRAHLR